MTFYNPPERTEYIQGSTYSFLEAIFDSTYGKETLGYFYALIDTYAKETATMCEQNGLIKLKYYKHKVTGALPDKCVQLTWKGLWFVFLYKKSKSAIS
jgi:hypothetical protein